MIALLATACTDEVAFRRFPDGGFVRAPPDEVHVAYSPDDLTYFEGEPAPPPVDWDDERVLIVRFAETSGCSDYWPGAIASIERDVFGNLHVAPGCGAFARQPCNAIVHPYDAAIVARAELTGEVVVDEACRAP